MVTIRTANAADRVHCRGLEGGTDELSHDPSARPAGPGARRLALAAAPVAGQGPEGGASGAPRTAWGDPDLQGIWSSSGATPMERPDEFQGRERLTDEEVARLRGEIAARNDELAQAEARRTQAGGNVGAYNNFWMERGVRSNRTSMLVDPPDGRFPPLTEAGRYARDNQPRGDDTWEDRHIWERCLTRGGMPNAMFPGPITTTCRCFRCRATS